MDKLNLEEDILIYCQTANSFPDGVQAAHKALHALVAFDEKRNYFGLSWPGRDGKIVYKAAAEELLKGELSVHDLESKTIAKGEYLYIDISDFMKNIPAIAAAFQQLIHDDRVAPDGFCIEWYLTQTFCRCMIKTKN